MKRQEEPKIKIDEIIRIGIKNEEKIKRKEEPKIKIEDNG